MKKIKRKFLILSSLAIIVVVVACSKKFLDKPPLGTLNPQIMANQKGVQGLLIGAYSLVDGEGTAGDGFASGASNWIFGGVTSDDAYKGSDPTDVADAAPMEKWVSLTPTNGAIPQKWAMGFAGAARCNDVLATMALATDIPADKVAEIEAQVRFLRAFYHFELKKVFGNIPYADETLTPENTDNTVDAWPKIEADLTAAIGALPDAWPGEPGRANVWAAKALLAKVYMFQGPSKYASAYPILQDLIANGKTAGGAKYGLNDHFYSNFNPAQKNSKESVFAAQTSVQDNSSVDWGGDPNGNYGDILNFPYTGGPGACCGFYNPSQSLANVFKTDGTTGLPLADPYSGPAVGAETGTAYSGTVDPRIDWTMGRPGIPYLDWGIHPGITWIRNPANDGNKSPLKNVYAASQKDAYTDVGSAYWGPTELVANNVNIIRFADIILWAAECEVEANDLTGAANHVNLIRSRMIDHPEAWVKTGPGGNSDKYDAASAIYTAGTNADNYKIGLYPVPFASQDAARTAVRTERQLELAMEGQRFFDLVRWGIAETTINAFIAREKAARPLKSDAHFTANKNEYMPIPQSEIDNLNADGVQHLKQNQGY